MGKGKGKERMAPAVAQEATGMIALLGDFEGKLRELQGKISDLRHSAGEETDEPLEESASFLAVKQQLLLSYCTDLCLYGATKFSGQSVAGAPVMRRLLELRTFTEKLRPIDSRLRYQTDKLLRLATTGAGAAADDPLSHRPNPDALLADADEDAEEDDAEPDALSGGAAALAGGRSDAALRRGGSKAAGAAGYSSTAGEGAYRPPKLAAVPYDDDDGPGGAARRDEKRQERRRERMRRSEIMAGLQEEFGDRPELVEGGVGGAGGRGGAAGGGFLEGQSRRLKDDDEERRRFEEDHMVRLTTTRKQKKERRAAERQGSRLDSLADLDGAADFVRMAKRGGGGGGSLADLAGGGSGGKAKGRGGAASKNLKRAIGAVGKSYVKRLKK